MFGFNRFLKKRLKGKTAKDEVAASSEAVRHTFTNKYLNFKTLLNTNNEVLEIIDDMEQAHMGSRSFGMSFIRAHCTAISVNIYKIVRCFNEITAHRYKGLVEVLEGILAKIDQELSYKKSVTHGELVLSLETVDKTTADQVGAKMATLGEVKNRIGIPVPEGFVITAVAYEHFMGHAGLQDEINRRIRLLEPDDIAQFHRTSTDIQQLIMNASFPSELEAAMIEAHAELMKKLGGNFNVSMRSSALGEDTKAASFAGQYRSCLNVTKEHLIDSYKEVVASKYSVPAMAYRFNRGFRDEDIIMCVGCLAMVNAKAGGVIYSADPGNIRNKYIIINAVQGLGKAVVDGSITPDLFVLSKDDPKIHLKKEIGIKRKRLVCGTEEGICHIEVLGKERNDPAITDEQAHLLGELALRLEKHFGAPQDIEWALGPNGSIVILQTRPLRIRGEALAKLRGIPKPTSDLPVISDSGITASAGLASGPAFVVETVDDMLQFPRGAVLVTRNPLPQWAALLDSAVAVVTDGGGVTGHLAAVAREFKVPALFGTSTATRNIHNGEIITVDASGHTIYAGQSDSLPQEPAEKESVMKGSPVHITLGRVLKHIAPLNLTDPDAPNFKPEGCQTIHDITRFAHEISLRELFDYKNKETFARKHLAKRLVLDVPMQWWVVDLNGGFKKGVEGDTVTLEDIASIPMLTLWAGMTAVPWKGPPPVDTKGFLSIIYGATMNRCLVPGMPSRYAERNYFIISRNFCHLSSRFGFHFSTVEAFFGEKVAENYLCFNFHGGGADPIRRERRAKLIQLILEKFDFWVQTKGDLVFARLERQNQDFLKKRLKILGYLLIHTRQLDMVLSSDARVQYYAEEMFKEIASFVLISQ